MHSFMRPITERTTPAKGICHSIPARIPGLRPLIDVPRQLHSFYCRSLDDLKQCGPIFKKKLVLSYGSYTSNTLPCY